MQVLFVLGGSARRRSEAWEGGVKSGVVQPIQRRALASTSCRMASLHGSKAQGLGLCSSEGAFITSLVDHSASKLSGNARTTSKY
jgi:hypothetical protein